MSGGNGSDDTERVLGSVEMVSASASVEKEMGEMVMGGEGAEGSNTHTDRGDSVGVLPSSSSSALLSPPLSVGSSGGSIEKRVGFQTQTVKVQIDDLVKES